MATTIVVQSPTPAAEFPDPVVVLPPPPPLQDDPEGAVAARQRLAPKSRLSQLFGKSKLTTSASTPSLRKRRKSTTSEGSSQDNQGPSTQSIDVDRPINLDNTALIGEDTYQDRYEWAIVYENQRGYVYALTLTAHSHLCSMLQNDRLLITLLFKSVATPLRPITFYASQRLPETLKAAPHLPRNLPAPRWQLALGLPLLDD